MTEPMTTVRRDASRFAGGAGVVAASCAALCCSGAPILLSVLSATGLSWLRNDLILLPIIAIALVLALWGFWRSQRVHGVSGPLILGLLGSVALVTGVLVLHGVESKVGIGAGTLALFAATIWNARLPLGCDVR
jgi:mercuric ion transport protein